MRGKIGDVFWRWADLDAFTQGYIEAAKQARRSVEGHSAAAGGNFYLDWRFSDLAPEALARIIADCAEEVARWATPRLATAYCGREFWEARQTGTFAGERAHLRPLTPTLGDDGKVYLAEVQS